MPIKKITILGSTCSIGDSALKVLSSSNGNFKVLGLSTESNIQKLSDQIKKFKPSSVAIINEKTHETFYKKYKNSWIKEGLKVYSGANALEKVATEGDADLLLSGVVGAVGLPPLLASLRLGRTVALANKEALIMAGELVTQTAKKFNAKILPVDSEHSAMFQCLEGQNGNEVYKIILTASGGPFYRFKGDLSKVSVEKALAHPNWVMGKKITIDSATLMNKGLEKIEAHYLFNVPFDKIQIVINPQSIIHSAVEFIDGSILAQLSHPDMCLPIQYALTYPQRRSCPIKRLEFTEFKRFDFENPDFHKFPCLRIALEAAKSGGTMPTVLSAANEIAVYAFLNKKISFTDIPKVVEKTLSLHKKIIHPDLKAILTADLWARNNAEEIIAREVAH